MQWHNRNEIEAVKHANNVYTENLLHENHFLTINDYILTQIILRFVGFVNYYVFHSSFLLFWSLLRQF